MKKYIIAYIDGHDHKYKTFETKAENKDCALHNLRESYTNGDFDHGIIEVREVASWNTR